MLRSGVRGRDKLFGFSGQGYAWRSSCMDPKVSVWRLRVQPQMLMKSILKSLVGTSQRMERKNQPVGPMPFLIRTSQGSIPQWFKICFACERHQDPSLGVGYLLPKNLESSCLSPNLGPLIPWQPLAFSTQHDQIYGCVQIIAHLCFDPIY